MKPFRYWDFHKPSFTLTCSVPQSRGYYIILSECTTSAAVLDWIAQVAAKAWATDAIVGDLVRSLDEVLPLQANLCGGGREQGPVDMERAVRPPYRP